MDKRGGKREGAGRKPRSDEQKLIEKLSPYEDLAHTKLAEAIKNGKDWAIKLFFEYMYSKPKQSVDARVTAEALQTIIERKIVKGDS